MPGMEWVKTPRRRSNGIAGRLDRVSRTRSTTLGVMYAQGRGVPQDFVRAYVLYNFAAAEGFELAAENRNKLAARMTSAQIEAAQALSRRWRPGQPLPLDP